MSCYNPLYALDFGINNDTGKRMVKILPRRPDLYSKKQLEARYGCCVLPLPCGRCIGCKLSKAREWAVRCVLELKEHDQSCFITLTYDEEHRPGHLLKSDFQKFIKDLRNDGHQVRYFGCGELGTRSRREHYHIILFGYCPGDLKVWSKGDNPLFTSKYLDSVWSKGRVIVGQVSFDSCGYVARYTMKKAYGGTGGEFILMSKKPGIGAKYLEDHAAEIAEFGALYGSFGSSHVAPPPRYFEKLADKLGISCDISKTQKEDAAKALEHDKLIDHRFEDVERLYSYEEKLKNASIKSLKRLKV